MFATAIRVNLPSQPHLRAPTPLDRFRGWLGDPVGLETGKDEVTVSSLALIAGIAHAFAASGVDDAVWLLVDDQLVFFDVIGNDGDLEKAWAAAHRTGVAQRPFRRMSLAVADRTENLQILLALDLLQSVFTGQPHLTIEVRARPLALGPRVGDTADTFSARARAFIRDSAALAAGRAEVAERSAALAALLEHNLGPDCTATVDPVSVRIVVPDRRQKAAFAKLDFGAVAGAIYRPAPAWIRPGAQPDPFVHYCDDPYWDLASQTMARELRWPPAVPEVVVVDPEGHAIASVQGA